MDGPRCKGVNMPAPFEVVSAGQARLAWERTDAGGGMKEMGMDLSLKAEEADGLLT